MMGRPLMTVDELKSMPKGDFIVMKTGTYPMRVHLKLYFEWGIIFGEPFIHEDRGARQPEYSSRVKLTAAITDKFPQVVKVPKAGPMVIEHTDEEDEEIIEMDPSNDEKRKTNIRTNR